MKINEALEAALEDRVEDNNLFSIRKVEGTKVTNYLVRFKKEALVDKKEVDFIKMNNKNSNVEIIFKDKSIKRITVLEAAKETDKVFTTAIKKTLQEIYK